MTHLHQHIQQITGWPIDIICHISSEEEANIYIRAKLHPARIGGHWALVRSDIEWSDFSIRRNTWLRNFLKDYEEWTNYNNADLIGEGYPPRDYNGDPYELHHIGQHRDSPFAELTREEHMGNGNNTILHKFGKESEIDRSKFDKEKSEYWQARFIAFSDDEKQKIYGTKRCEMM